MKSVQAELASRPESLAGWPSAALAVFTGAVTIGAIIGTSGHIRPVLPICLAGALFLTVGILLGSDRLVGLATAPVLAAALIEVVLTEDSARLRSVVLGCLWYATVELAWDSIERRGVARRSAAVVRARVHEVVTVLAISLAATTIGLAATRYAPERSLLLRAAVVAILLAAVFAAARHLTSSATTATSPEA